MRELIALMEGDAVIGASVLYHGTSTTEAAEAIMRDGLKGRDEQGSSHLAPRADMVYLTPDLKYAMIYAASGDIIGHVDSRIKDLTKPVWGYVFVVKRDELSDLDPDEDSVGEYVYRFGKLGEAVRGRTYHPGGSAQYRSSVRRVIFDPEAVPKNVNAAQAERVFYNIATSMSDLQLMRSMEGYTSYQAAGGKKALKRLSRTDKDFLLSLPEVHAAHQGSVMPYQCWRFDRRQTKEINQHNFFQKAELIWPRPTQPMMEGAPTGNRYHIVEMDDDQLSLLMRSKVNQPKDGERCRLRYLYCDQRQHHIVALYGKQVVGAASVEVNPRNITELWFQHVSIVEEARGRGIAVALIESCFQYAEHRGFKLSPSSFTEDGQKLKAVFDRFNKKYPTVDPKKPHKNF